MIDKEKILELYTSRIKHFDVDNPLIHLSSEQDVQHYGEHLNSLLEHLGGEISVADIGCAVGNMLRYVDEKFLRTVDYTGFDLNENFIALAKNRWKDFPNLKFVQYDISECNLPQNFDVILVNETFSYFNAAEIIAMIDYYAAKANKIFSASLLTGENYPAHLMIEKTNPYEITEYVLKNYAGAKISRDYKLRIEILKGGIDDDF